MGADVGLVEAPDLEERTQRWKADLANGAAWRRWQALPPAGYRA
jgi:hypothetical protein